MFPKPPSNIFHECVHYDQHYMFFRLQAMGSNDPRKVKVREVIVDKDQEVTDPIYFMEKQANRGAYGLMLPATDTKKIITSEYEKVENYRHIGERYEIAGKAISRQQCIPHFRIRARMIQLGFVQAKGALNYVERKLIQPFAFDLDAWREEQHTFVVDRWTTNALYRKNEEFQAVMDSGKYVYADGHVVRNDPRFVEKKGEDFFLTEWASAHVDDCCLRFVRQYVQQNVGRYDNLHTDACIYSPGVVICKTDDAWPERMEEKDWVTVDVISCAAPNLRKRPGNYHNPEYGSAQRFQQRNYMRCIRKEQSISSISLRRIMLMLWYLVLSAAARLPMIRMWLPEHIKRPSQPMRSISRKSYLLCIAGRMKQKNMTPLRKSS